MTFESIFNTLQIIHWPFGQLLLALMIWRTDNTKSMSTFTKIGKYMLDNVTVGSREGPNTSLKYCLAISAQNFWGKEMSQWLKEKHSAETVCWNWWGYLETAVWVPIASFMVVPDTIRILNTCCPGISYVPVPPTLSHIVPSFFFSISDNS